MYSDSQDVVSVSIKKEVVDEDVHVVQQPPSVATSKMNSFVSPSVAYSVGHLPVQVVKSETVDLRAIGERAMAKSHDGDSSRMFINPSKYPAGSIKGTLSDCVYEGTIRCEEIEEGVTFNECQQKDIRPALSRSTISNYYPRRSETVGTEVLKDKHCAEDHEMTNANNNNRYSSDVTTKTAALNSSGVSDNTQVLPYKFQEQRQLKPIPNTLVSRKNHKNWSEQTKSIHSTRVKTDRRMFCCKQCNAPFLFVADFIKHDKLHDKERPLSTSLNRSHLTISPRKRKQTREINMEEQPKVRFHICNVCESVFLSKLALQEHMHTINEIARGNDVRVGKKPREDSTMHGANHWNKPRTGRKRKRFPGDIAENGDQLFTGTAAEGIEGLEHAKKAREMSRSLNGLPLDHVSGLPVVVEPQAAKLNSTRDNPKYLPIFECSGVDCLNQTERDPSVHWILPRAGTKAAVGTKDNKQNGSQGRTHITTLKPDETIFTEQPPQRHATPGIGCYQLDPNLCRQTVIRRHSSRQANPPNFPQSETPVIVLPPPTRILLFEYDTLVGGNIPSRDSTSFDKERTPHPWPVAEANHRNYRLFGNCSQSVSHLTENVILHQSHPTIPSDKHIFCDARQSEGFFPCDRSFIDTRSFDHGHPLSGSCFISRPYLSQSLPRENANPRKVTPEIRCSRCKLCRRHFTTIEEFVKHCATGHSSTSSNTVGFPVTTAEFQDEGWVSINNRKNAVASKTPQSSPAVAPEKSNRILEHRDYHKTQACSNYGAFACQYCACRFNTSHGLSAHQRVHLPKKSFRCEACHERFRTKMSLDYHRLVNEDCALSFICPVCDVSQPQHHETINHAQRKMNKNLQ